jgi:hypothetical protein
LAGAGLDQLQRLLDEYPSGWARRRVLETLLRAGIPSRVDDALALVERLGTAGERMWALTTLVATHDLDQEEQERLVAAAGGSSFARRLRGRLGRARPLTARG